MHFMSMNPDTVCEWIHHIGYSQSQIKKCEYINIHKNMEKFNCNLLVFLSDLLQVGVDY